MIRGAIAGAGGMAHMHASCYTANPNACVVGVYDKRPEAAAEMAAANGATAYASFAEMLDAARPDVVDVCVPTPWHVDYVVAAAEAGLKGIVVEKPMGRSVADCERMAAACAASGTPLFVAHVLRFFPEFAEAKRQVDAGAVGNVVTVRTRRGGSFPRAWENWYGKPDWSGGVILDLVIHDLDWLRWTFGDVERVFAKGISPKLPPDSEVTSDYALITLKFKSGLIGHVEATWADPGGFKVGFEIAGDAGLLESNFNQPAGVPFMAALQRGAEAGAAVAVPESPTAVNPYYAELDHFLTCLATGATPSITPRDGCEAVRIALAAFESAQTGEPVVLP